MELEEWIGKEAFGLGCEIAVQLRTFCDSDIELPLRNIMWAIKKWSEKKANDRQANIAG